MARSVLSTTSLQETRKGNRETKVNILRERRWVGLPLVKVIVWTFQIRWKCNFKFHLISNSPNKLILSWDIFSKRFYQSLKPVSQITSTKLFLTETSCRVWFGASKRWRDGERVLCSASLISRCLCINLHYMRSATQHNSTVCPVQSTLRSHWYAAFLWRCWSPVVAVTRRSEKECITTNLPSYLATWEGVYLVHISTPRPHLLIFSSILIGGERYVWVVSGNRSS